MSTAPKPQQPLGTTTATPRSSYSSSKPAAASKPEMTLLFDKENYMWMIGGVALIFIGFMLMSGGKSPNPHEFHYEEIYSFRRITLAPIVILLGFAVEVYAIIKKPKDAQESTEA